MNEIKRCVCDEFGNREALHKLYGTIRPTALETDVCPSVWCGYSVPAAG